MRFSFFVYLIVATTIVLVPQVGLAKERKNPFSPVPHYNYKTQKIGTLKSGDDALVMERAYIHVMGKGKAPFQRLQLRNKYGYIIAYSPTRMSFITLCPNVDRCYVFMWKTVYPLPAIFKLELDKADWNNQKKPPMIYSRLGVPGTGFIDITNPFFGLIGLVIHFFKFIWYYGLVAFLTIIFCIQLTKFYDWNGWKKEWVTKILMLFNIFSFLQIPIEPYILTVLLIVAMNAIGVVVIGLPSVVVTMTVMVTFFLTVLRIAKIRRAKLNL